MKHTKKLLFIAFFTINAFSTAHYASADDLADMSPVDAMGDIIDDLGIDENELKYAIQTFNVSRKKKQPPLVSLVFDPANPAPGQKVTVIANPTYFNNSSNDLYFTWFLKPTGCPDKKDDNPSASLKNKCDFDGNGKIDIQDYKTKAMRLIANDDFDWDKDGDLEADAQTYSTSREDDDGYKSIWGGNDQKGKNNFCYVHDIESGDEYEIKCDKHLFPDVPTGKIGDGSFDIDEEKFWHTDPHDPDTADTGNGDEANIAGLGVVSFSWTYEQGDAIGVAVEGVSNEPTQEEDSSYRTMWALSKNTCNLGDTNGDYPHTHTSATDYVPIYDGFGTITSYSRTITETKEKIIHQISFMAEIETTITIYTEITDANKNVISYTGVSQDPTTSFINIADDIEDEMRISQASDIDKCLYKNFVDPYEGGGEASNLDVLLSYLPQDPMNDPTQGSNEGDELVIHSSIANAHDSKYLNYSWQVYQSDAANPESWGSPILKENLKNSTQTTGLGLSTFKFQLNFPDPKKHLKYLKVKLTVKENAGNGAVREGHGSVVIPITSASERIRVYGSAVSLVDENLILEPDSIERCAQGMDKVLCPVIKNEIIALQVDGEGLTDFLWAVNGEPLSYKECFFDDCRLDRMGNTIFFPALEDPGFEYDVSLAATDQESGQKINIHRTFKVAEPEVTIISADESSCKPILLGHYVDMDGKLWPDYSKTDFVALREEIIRLKAVPNSPSIRYDWYLNGIRSDADNTTDLGHSFDNDRNLVLPGKEVGGRFEISVGAYYTQDALVKKALNKYWGVGMNNFYEKQTSATIKIVSVAALTEGSLGSAQGKNKILASVYSAVPAYLAFLLRIVLTAFLMLLTSRFILSFFPDMKPYRE